MAQCDLVGGCIFFNDKMADMPAISERYKDKYCRDSFRSCARFQIYVEFGREHVPVNLFPNQEHSVADIKKRLNSTINK